jgi:predicted permease
MRLWKRVVFLSRRGRFNREMEEEIRIHLEMKVKENLAAGMSPEEARCDALRRFGNRTLAYQDSQEVWMFRSFETVLQDLRYALRMLKKNRGFTVAVVLSLALGIGANTAIFSLIDAVMLKNLPVSDPQELVLMSWASKKWPHQFESNYSGSWGKDELGRETGSSFSYPVFKDLQEHNHVFSDVLAFYDFGNVNLVDKGRPGLASAQLVSGNYYSALGVHAAAGRTIEPTDDQLPGNPVAMISYGYWRRRFGLDPSIVGSQVEVSNVPFTIIGVTPPEFFGLQPGQSVDLFMPIALQMRLNPDWSSFGKSIFGAGDLWWVRLMGRLKPGVTERQAGADLDVILRQTLTAAHSSGPDPQQIPQIELQRGSKGMDSLRQQFSQPLLLLMTVVGLVLLIACANVANLHLARASARQREISVRLALGAGRRRLIRQLLTESVLLATLGGALGLIFASWSTHALLALVASGLDRVSLEVRPDARVLAFTAAVSLLVGILFGLAPAFRATRVQIAPSLKASAGVRSTAGAMRMGLGKALMVAQVAISLLLLIGAGLFVRTLQNLEHMDAGFNAKNVVLFSLNPELSGYQEGRLLALYEELEQKIGALPGVRAVTSSMWGLIGGGDWMRSIVIHGAKLPGDATEARAMSVGPDFFETMQIPILRGRGIAHNDDGVAPRIAVVNHAFVRQYFPNQDPIGRRFDSGSNHDIEIVGVAQDVRYDSMRQDPPPMVYLPYRQTGAGARTFEVRIQGDPATAMAGIRRVIGRIDTSLPIYDVKTQTEQIDQSLVQERLVAILSSSFGFLAMVLAAVGLYGVMSYLVARRTNEIGIRMALGARRLDMLRLVLGETLTMAVIGVGIGLVAAYGCARLISNQLFGLKATDPATLLLAASALTVVAGVAGYLPAQRASRVDPTVALRYE